MSQQPKPKQKKPLSVRVGRGALNVHGIFSYIFLYAPILLLVVFSFNDSRFAAAAWKGFTFR